MLLNDLAVTVFRRGQPQAEIPRNTKVAPRNVQIPQQVRRLCHEHKIPNQIRHIDKIKIFAVQLKNLLVQECYYSLNELFEDRN